MSAPRFFCSDTCGALILGLAVKLLDKLSELWETTSDTSLLRLTQLFWHLLQRTPLVTPQGKWWGGFHRFDFSPPPTHHKFWLQGCLYVSLSTDWEMAFHCLTADLSIKYCYFAVHNVLFLWGAILSTVVNKVDPAIYHLTFKVTHNFEALMKAI